ncbi:hypothetical protein [Boseongicola aestuarii]|uniref:Uncharacterized protein n=1 Tax=Boseongicola aestuarii TaxID=1470561 RepID=A0A238IZH5_9RHOB|nr:hypothetical protein [Boseongicola aestuarii]SMX23796.1 hypothetical protein BOA8489_01909 [Boseongicola aestuarii]
MNRSSKEPPHTLFIGAPTALGHALNALVRGQTVSLGSAGVAAHPNKIVTYALRAAIGDRPDPTHLNALVSTASDRHLFLSALFALGRPRTALRDNELFPEAERMLGEISAVLGDHVERVVLAIEPVHHLLLSVEREQVFSRPGGVKWDALYEVSWADLVDVVATCFGGAELVVLTPFSVGNGAAPILYYLFGNKGFDLASEAAGEGFLRAAQRVPVPDEIKAHTGLDRVACDLLLQRFDEDVATISRRSRVRVF